MTIQRVLVVDDEENIRHMLQLILRRAGYEVESAVDGEAALDVLARSSFDVVLADLRMPRLDGLGLLAQMQERSLPATVIVMSAYGSNETAIEAMKRGAYDYLNKPFAADEVVLVLRKAEERERLKAENQRLLSQIRREYSFQNVIARSPRMQEIFRTCEKIAEYKSTVLLHGESGTGKELIARAVHYSSQRAAQPFVAVNCGAIPENLLESELFGHVKGSFTGAIRDKKGLFEEADGGTLFLDEIGELPLALQVKLLRALQEKTVTRVGANRPETVDIRVLAATNRDLENEIREGRFREDLYYRLNVVTLLLPPLRERGDDVLLLARYLLERYNKEFNRKIKGFTSDALIALRKYPWPGNIRQLENKIKKAVVLSDKPLLSPEELDLEPEFIQPVMTLVEAKEQFQRRYISEVLERNGGNRTKTAHELGVDPRTIFRFLEKEQGRS